DPEQRARGAVPEELTNHTVHLCGGPGRRMTHGEVDAEADAALARQERAVAHRGGKMVRRHEPYRLGAQDAHAIQLATVEEHARESEVVVERGAEAERAWLQRPLLRVQHLGGGI